MSSEHPKWLETFQDFPPIPEVKKWNNVNEDGMTPEQTTLKKFTSNATIDNADEKVLKEAMQFYERVIPRLRNFSIVNLNQTELDEFKSYFHYAFNYILLIENMLTVTGLFRMVRNSSVPTEKGKIREAKYLSYPPLEVVKRIGEYNRANSPETNLFYGADSIDNVLYELKPTKGETVSVGIWVPKSDVIKLRCYPVTHNPLAVQVNPHTQHGFLALQKMKPNHNPRLMKFMDTIFEFISNEFAKPVKNHLDYFFSATFAERIFQSTSGQDDWRFDCISYPSVGNQLTVENLAIIPSAISNFRLSKVIQFEVERTHYELKPPRQDQMAITSVTPKNYIQTDWIDKDGNIVW